MAEPVLATSGFVPTLVALIEGYKARVRLYVNPRDPSPEDVAGDYDEAIFPGYLAVTLNRWTPPALRSGRAFSDADPTIFRLDGPGESPPIYGAYATDSLTGALLWVWPRPGGPLVLTDAQPLLIVSVRLLYPSPPGP